MSHYFCFQVILQNKTLFRIDISQTWSVQSHILLEERITGVRYEKEACWKIIETCTPGDVHSHGGNLAVHNSQDLR
jgi:hypothetical protein